MRDKWMLTDKMLFSIDDVIYFNVEKIEEKNVITANLTNGLRIVVFCGSSKEECQGALNKLKNILMRADHLIILSNSLGG